MVIAFWSPEPGRGAVTTNLQLAAAAFALNGKGKCLMLRNFGDAADGRGGRASFDGKKGLWPLLMNIRSCPVTGDVIADSVTEVIRGRLDLLECSGYTKQGGAADEMLLARLPQICSRYYSHVFVDIGCASGTVAQYLLREADTVVVNMRQTRPVRGELLPDCRADIFYLIGQYTMESRYLIANLRRGLPELNRENSAVIPFCGCIADAEGEDGLADLMDRYRDRTGRGADAGYMRQVYDAADRIYEFSCRNPACGRDVVNR